MLYLFALLAIAAKAQTDTSCETPAGTLDCTDALVKAAYTEAYGDVDLACYDLAAKSGIGTEGIFNCYPPYCGDGSTCEVGECIGFTYCGVLDSDTTSVTTCGDSNPCSVGTCITVSGSTAVCIEGACNLDGDDCDTGETCYAVDTSLGYGACVTGITGTDCDCTESDCDCASGESCITYEGVGICATGVTACTKSSQCSGDTDTCATDYGFCYKSCSSNSGCSTGETCQTDPASGLKGCGEPDCTSTSDCSGSLVCDSDGEGDCVICVDDDDCTANSAYGADYSCQNSVCIADSCEEDSDACGAYVCTADGACVICELDGDDCTTGTSCYAVDGVNACYAYDPASVNNNDDGINQITTYIAMVIMAMVAVNM